MSKKTDKEENSLNSLGALPKVKLSGEVKRAMKEGEDNYKQVKKLVITGNNAVTELLKGKIVLTKLAKFDSKILPTSTGKEFKELVAELNNTIDSIDKVLAFALEEA